MNFDIINYQLNNWDIIFQTRNNIILNSSLIIQIIRNILNQTVFYNLSSIFLYENGNILNK